MTEEEVLRLTTVRGDDEPVPTQRSLSIAHIALPVALAIQAPLTRARDAPIRVAMHPFLAAALAKIAAARVRILSLASEAAQAVDHRLFDNRVIGAMRRSTLRSSRHGGSAAGQGNWRDSNGAIDHLRGASQIIAWGERGPSAPPATSREHEVGAEP